MLARRECAGIGPKHGFTRRASTAAKRDSPQTHVKEKYLSTNHEPAIGGGRFETDPAEKRAAAVDRSPEEIDVLRDSVANEPALPQHADPQQWNCWLQQKRRDCTLSGNLAVTLLAAVASGPFAILGALTIGRQGVASLVYVVLLGPVVEELLKQSGMTYLLEKKPYRLFAAWQFVFAGAMAGLAFGVIENLVYIHVYAPLGGVKDVARLAAFRWVVCTSLHVGCATIASLGLVRVWKRQLADGRPAELSAAFGWFAAAIVLHGLYNLGAVFVEF